MLNITTEQEAINAVNNGISLPDIPEALRTISVCTVAVTKCAWALQYVPETLRTMELCTLAVQQNGWTLQHVPESLRTVEMCTLAVKQDGWSLQFVPDPLRTMELYTLAVKQKGLALQLVPVPLRTVEICTLAVKQNGEAFRFVPDTLQNFEICIAAVTKHGLALRWVPDALRTLELCTLAVTNCIWAFQFVPKSLWTVEFYTTAVMRNSDFLQCVPESLQEEVKRRVSDSQRADVVVTNIDFGYIVSSDTDFKIEDCIITQAVLEIPHHTFVRKYNNFSLYRDKERQDIYRVYDIQSRQGPTFIHILDEEDVFKMCGEFDKYNIFYPETVTFNGPSEVTAKSIAGKVFFSKNCKINNNVIIDFSQHVGDYRFAPDTVITPNEVVTLQSEDDYHSDWLSLAGYEYVLTFYKLIDVVKTTRIGFTMTKINKNNGERISDKSGILDIFDSTGISDICENVAHSGNLKAVTKFNSIIADAVRHFSTIEF